MAKAGLGASRAGEVAAAAVEAAGGGKLEQAEASAAAAGAASTSMATRAATKELRAKQRAVMKHRELLGMVMADDDMASKDKKEKLAEIEAKIVAAEKDVHRAEEGMATAVLGAKGAAASAAASAYKSIAPEDLAGVATAAGKAAGVAAMVAGGSLEMLPSDARSRRRGMR